MRRRKPTTRRDADIGRPRRARARYETDYRGAADTYGDDDDTRGTRVYSRR